MSEKPISSQAKNLILDIYICLSQKTVFERWVHIFWLSGPFILLIERSPADFWVSIIALTFVTRSFIKRDFSWLNIFWVKMCFVFLSVCILSSAFSNIPLYSLGEAIAWFRFPLFAMATVFWLATDKRLLYGMLFTTLIGMMIMTGILAAEILIEGQKGGRLSWPYGDLVPGNYLAKVGLPAFTVMVALAIGAKPKLAFFAGLLSLISIVMSVLTGERINFLIRACGGMLAALVWKPELRRYCILIVVEIFALAAVFTFMPSMQNRFTAQIVEHLPTGPQSDYYRVMGAGIKVFKTSPLLGVGPATHRKLCPEIVGVVDKRISSEFRCDNHPHNFYIQFLAETGIIGFFVGVVMLSSITWAAFSGWRYARDNVVAATAFVIPLGLFFPIASFADFFGQWNNIFMWSALALALASGRTLINDRSG